MTDDMSIEKLISAKTLKKGDLFRGKHYKKGKNHIFKEIVTLDDGQVLVVSMCNYWFYPDYINEPSEDKENICSFCKTWIKDGRLVQ